MAHSYKKSVAILMASLAASAQASEQHPLMDYLQGHSHLSTGLMSGSEATNDAQDFVQTFGQVYFNRTLTADETVNVLRNAEVVRQCRREGKDCAINEHQAYARGAMNGAIVLPEREAKANSQRKVGANPTVTTWMDVEAHNSTSTNNTTPTVSSTTVFPTAESLDWTERGMVTSVKNQGSCGSCWAFAGTAG